MKKWTKTFLTSFVLTLTMSITAFAGQWKQDHIGWWYQKDDGSWYANGWEWIDGNCDGVAECYYFTPDGYLVVDGIADGYTVNADGAWTENGVIQRKVTVDPSNDAAAIALYQAAQAKYAALDCIEADASYIMDMTIQDMNVKAGMDLNLKMTGVRGNNLQYVMDGTMEMFGATFPVTMFYKDGWYYTDMMDMKIKQPMDIATAIANVNENTGVMEMNLAMIRNMKAEQKDSNTVLTYDMSQEALNNYVQAALAQTGTAGEGLSGYKINSASASVTIDANGNLVQDQVLMDMEMSVIDPETGTTSDVKYVMDVECNYKNLGQTFTLTFPSTEGYTDVTQKQ